MSSRTKRLLSTTLLGCMLMCSNIRADTLPVSEQVDQYSSQEGVMEDIYDKIVDGETIIDVSDDSEDLRLRANIDVSEERKDSQGVNANNISHNSRSANSNRNLGESIADLARSLVGKPYSYGSTGPNSFDCSGFVKYVYGKFGIVLPRTSQSQAYVGTRIRKDELQPGDLIFSNTYGTLSHVGIYIGNGEFVHAANTSTGVTVSSATGGYYSTRYAWSTRPY